MRNVELIIMNKIYINTEQLSQSVLKEIKDALTYHNPKYHKVANGYGRYAAENIELYFLSYEMESKNVISVSRGAIYKLKRILISNKYKITIIDKRLKRQYSEPFLNNIKPFQYQLDAIEKGKKYQNCLIQGETGSGKTEIGLKIACDLNQYTLIIVPTLELLDQWIQRVKNKIENWQEILGQWGNGKKEIKPLTIGIVNSCNRDSEYLSDKFGTIIVDEAHRSPSTMFSNIINKSHAYYRIALTATPYRKDKLEFLMFDQFGKIVESITIEDMEKEGRVSPVDVVVIPTNLECEAYNLSRDELRERNLTEVSFNQLMDLMINDRDRNNLIFKELRKNLSGYNLLLTDRVEFARKWKRVLESKANVEVGLMLGGKKNKPESSLTKERMEKGDLHVAIGTTVADEGLDIPRLTHIYCTTPTANNKRRIRQQRGRVCRVFDGKEKGYLYYFCDIKIRGFQEYIRNLIKYLPESKIYVKYNEELVDAKIFLKMFNSGKVSL